jgi:hypothetical protein
MSSLDTSAKKDIQLSTQTVRGNGPVRLVDGWEDDSSGGDVLSPITPCAGDST